MGKNSVDRFVHRRSIVAGLLGILSGALLFGLAEFVGRPEEPVPADKVDTIITFERDQTPLAAAPTVEKKVTGSTSTRKVVLSKAAERTCTRNLPEKTSTTTESTTTSDSRIRTATTVEVKTTEKYTRGSRKKVVKTRTRTTVITTTFRKASTGKQGGGMAAGGCASLGNPSVRYFSVYSLAPGMKSHILNAFDSLGFQVVVDPSLAQGEGGFAARKRTITLAREDSEEIYHELGHFLAFVAGNADDTSGFRSVFQKEKASFRGSRRGVACTDASEFFAECTREYILHPTELLTSCPRAYEAVEAAIGKVTIAQVAKISKTYARVWAGGR